MKTNPNPDRSDEARVTRVELEAENTRAADAGLRALDEFSRLSEEESDADIPPVPDDLRGKWRDRFGEVREEVSALTFRQKLGQIFSGKWSAVGALGAFALVMLVFSLDRKADDSQPVLRGNETLGALDVLTVFIPGNGMTFTDFEKMRGGVLLEAENEESAVSILQSHGVKRGLILNAAEFRLLEWSQEDVKTETIVDVEDSLELSEWLDEYIETLPDVE